MRKKQFVLFVCVSLLSWGVVTYFLFLNRPQSSRVSEKQLQLGSHLQKLEQELSEQFKANNNFLKRLRQLVDQKESQREEKEDVNEVKEDGEGEQRLEGNQEKKIDGAKNEKTDTEENEKADPVIAVLVFACNRVSVQRNLEQLVRYRPSKERFPIVVSQDCGHQATANVIAGFGDQVVHIRQPDLADIEVPPKEKKFKGYYKIARHYGWALNTTFNDLGHETVIIVEDDLDVSPDFFEYFSGTYWLLKRDPTLWCVSAWNDNGKAGLVDESASDLLYRTDFFPGLGWMMTDKLWKELGPKWPKAYWDDWIRHPEQRKNRACIRPEMSRTRTFGKLGVSNGLFFEKHLKYIKLNEKFVPFTQMNLSYLLKDNYDVEFVKKIYDSPVVTVQDLKSNSVKYEGPLRITYHTKDIYKRTAKILGLMDDFKSGVPRTGYRGVVSFWTGGRRVYLAPNANWKGYDLSWS